MMKQGNFQNKEKAVGEVLHLQSSSHPAANNGVLCAVRRITPFFLNFKEGVCLLILGTRQKRRPTEYVLTSKSAAIPTPIFDISRGFSRGWLTTIATASQRSFRNRNLMQKLGILRHDLIVNGWPLRSAMSFGDIVSDIVGHGEVGRNNAAHESGKNFGILFFHGQNPSIIFRVKKSGGAPTLTNGGGSRVAGSNTRKTGVNTAIRFFTPARIIACFSGGMGAGTFLTMYAYPASTKQGLGSPGARRVTLVADCNLPSYLSPKTPVVDRTITGEMSFALGRCVAAPTIYKYPAPINRCKRFPARGNESLRGAPTITATSEAGRRMAHILPAVIKAAA